MSAQTPSPPNARLSPATIAARAGVDQDPAHGAVMPPLYLSTNYAFEGFGRKRRYDYGRSGNPTRDLLGQALSELEGGAGAVITASGMAAVDLCLHRLAPSDLVVAPHDSYAGSLRLLKARAERGQFRLIAVDQTNPGALEAALAQRPALVLVETPSNPLVRITDIAAVAKAAHTAGAKVVVDNTFLSPALQRPLTLGADLVVHSTTKYLNGHSDVVGGAVIARDPADAEALAAFANACGVTGSPFDAWLTLRGLRTLFVRLERQQSSARRVAELLADHPAVARVHYPGLEAHPQYALAGRQQQGPGAMVSFELKGGEGAVRRLLEGLSLFVLAESLGGVESLVDHPASMTHAEMGPEGLKTAGIGAGLLRLSIGLEDPGDLTSDLSRALDAL
jgi:cystathionine gamma-synthase